MGTEPASDIDSRRFPLDIKRPHRAAITADREHPCPDHRGQQRPDVADSREERPSAREAETQRHWRLTAARWRDDDGAGDKVDDKRKPDRLPAVKPLSCFCSAGVICCRAAGAELGIGSVNCAYGTCAL